MKNVRVRFAPSPTGLLHLGSVRIALFNYLFAQQRNGTFVLRIEDTDPERNFDPGAEKILTDLAWLHLSYDEGPLIGGPFSPYFQSERSAIYQEKLDFLAQKQAIYRCFCTEEELEKKRARQIALKQAPRYDRTCLSLDDATVQRYLDEQKPFIWRFKIPHKTITINDLARGAISFDLKNFSDFPLTRKNGSFTFIFANAIDDMTMEISHVFRGEDHIANTPCQAVIYEAFNYQLPVFWHMPIICNINSKKLSKRDFGFSLQDLKSAGYIPEAINNYLAIIGSSFDQEIMTLPELSNTIDFERMSGASAIKYDVEKLTWVNHQWLLRLTPQILTQKAKPFLFHAYPAAQEISNEQLVTLIQLIQPELKTLKEVESLLSFYFVEPHVSKKDLLQHETDVLVNAVLAIIGQNLDQLADADAFFEYIVAACKQQEMSLKRTLKMVRIILIGSPQGPGIKELLSVLGPEKAIKRFKQVLEN